MAIKPISNGTSVSTTPTTLSNSVNVYVPMAALTVFAITDVANTVLYSISLPSSIFSNPIIISKRSTDYITSSNPVTMTPVAVTGSERTPVLKLLSTTSEINATSFSTFANATRVAVTTINNTLLTFYNQANTQYATLSVSANNVLVVSKNPTDTIVANTVSYGTKVAVNY